MKELLAIADGVVLEELENIVSKKDHTINLVKYYGNEAYPYIIGIYMDAIVVMILETVFSELMDKEDMDVDIYESILNIDDELDVLDIYKLSGEHFYKLYNESLEFISFDVYESIVSSIFTSDTETNIETLRKMSFVYEAIFVARRILIKIVKHNAILTEKQHEIYHTFNDVLDKLNIGGIYDAKI